MTKLNAVKGRDDLKLKEKYPTFSLLDYNLSLLKNLNFYNIEIEDGKLKKDWAIEYWKAEKKDVIGLARISDGYFSSAGAVAHMLMHRKLGLNDSEISYMDKKYVELRKMVVLEKEVKPQQSKESKEEAELSSHVAEFLGGVDLFFSGKEFDSKSYLIKNNVKTAMTRKVAEALKPTLKEATIAASGKDDDLTEGYSHLTKRQLTKFIAYVKGLIDSCETAAAITKAARKPRESKIKPPSEIVKNVKYLSEDPVSKLKSEHPSKIVKANEVWVYNAKLRRLYRYVALPGSQLSVKGTTIINIDQEKSSGKIIRKPESQLIGIQSLTSRPLNKFYNEIRGAETRASGRLNEESAIVKCIHQ